MDDLTGLDWNAPNNQSSTKPPSNTNNYPSLRPTPPLSGRSTPLTLQPQAATGKPPGTPNAFGKTSTSQNDSFANLLPFNAAQSTKNLSLREQQDLLQEQRKKQAVNEHRRWDAHFGGSGSASVSAQPSRTASPSGLATASFTGLQGQDSGQRLRTNLSNSSGIREHSSQLKANQNHYDDDEDDVLAAFNSSAPVDASTYFPVPDPSRSSSGAPSVPPTSSSAEQSQNTVLDDDDPFGLGTAPEPQAATRSQGSRPTVQLEDDDDVLGLLGRPVSELPPPKSPSSPSSVATEYHPVDKAVAELVDMGFSQEKSREALAATETGLDVQAAVGWLLHQAHAESRGKSHMPVDRGIHGSRADIATADGGSAEPAWMRQSSRPSSSRQRSESGRIPGADKDAAKYASELGNNLFKTANSLWKTGQKKLNKAVADFNADNDSSQPKWMRDASAQKELSRPLGRRESAVNGEEPRRKPSAVPMDMTDEAVLLEMGRERPQPAKSRTHVRATPPFLPTSPRPIVESKSTPPQQPARQSASIVQSRAKVTRRIKEEEQVQAYVSPARRKRPTPKAQEPEPELLFNTSQQSKPAIPPISSTATPSPQTQRPAVTRPSAPLPTRPKAPPRNIPSLSSVALQSLSSHRIAGTAAFKLGNYADATSFYTSALRDIPPNHPLAIILLTNRALTHLKTGDPKQCIVDADTALQVIGPSKGIDESIDSGGDEGKKDMSPYWGKAMMRRAEALEQLERWKDAAQVWKECVEAGVGGSTSIQGRNRCEKALKPSTRPAFRKPTPASKKSATGSVAPRVSALDDLSGRPPLPHAASSEAVTRLRAANEAAAKADDEKFALSDSVANRVDQWRKGKESNLRALLGSLDTVLWADSGWKKVGMGELLNPNKVKVNYMKGIAKVHPDKVRGTLSLPRTANHC